MKTRLDVGRVLLVPVFGCMFVLQAMMLAQQFGGADSLTFESAARQVRGGLIVLFYGLLVIAYMQRTRARSSSTSWVDRTVSVAATFAPPLLPLATDTNAPLGLVVTGNVLTFVGLAWSVWAVAVLRRSFSIIPEARELVRVGPYRFVRHPLYAGEMVTLLGIIISGLTFSTLTLWMMLCGAQAYRASREERLLIEALPEYRGYRQHTAALIPGVF